MRNNARRIWASTPQNCATTNHTAFEKHVFQGMSVYSLLVGFRYAYFYERVIENQNFPDRLESLIIHRSTQPTGTLEFLLSNSRNRKQFG